MIYCYYFQNNKSIRLQSLKQLKERLLRKAKGWQDAFMSKGSCCSGLTSWVWSLNSCKTGQRELSPKCCPLTSTNISWLVCSHTYNKHEYASIINTHTIIINNLKGKSKIEYYLHNSAHCFPVSSAPATNCAINCLFLRTVDVSMYARSLIKETLELCPHSKENRRCYDHAQPKLFLRDSKSIGTSDIISVSIWLFFTIMLTHAIYFPLE